MCEPTTLLAISLALSTATAAASYVSADRTAKRQVDAINTDNALQQNDLARQQDQQRAQAAGEMNDYAKQAQKDAALFDVVTGEYGGGKSADRAATVASVQAGEGLSTLGSNATNKLSEIGFASYAANSRAKSQVGAVAQPSMLGTALQIGSAAAGYQTGMNKQKQVSLNGPK